MPFARLYARICALRLSALSADDEMGEHPFPVRVVHVQMGYIADTLLVHIVLFRWRARKFLALLSARLPDELSVEILAA